MQINYLDTLRYFSIFQIYLLCVLLLSINYMSNYIIAMIILSKISLSINRPNFSFVTNIGNEIKEDKWLPRKTSNIPSYTSSNKKSESAHLSNHERRRKIAVSKNKLKWIYIVFLNNFCWTLLRGSINWPKRKSNLIKDKCNQCGITYNTSRSTGCSR